MVDQHRATPQQWTRIERMLCRTEFSAILELRDRIEALEAAAESNYPEKPDSSLLDQVEDALDMARGDSEAKARAAIREVAAWLREENPSLGGNSSAFASLLEQEAMQ